MRVGTLGRPGVFKLRSRAGRRKLSDRAPEAPDRRVVFNRVCLGCRRGQDLAKRCSNSPPSAPGGPIGEFRSRKADHRSSSAALLLGAGRLAANAAPKPTAGANG